MKNEVKGVAGSSSAAPAGVGSRILYVSRWSGSEQIYALDPSGRAPLGKVGAGDDAVDMFAPLPAPDGSHLVYRSGLAGDYSSQTVWIARSDGSDARALVAPPASLETAAWSSDSSRLAYIVHEPSSELQLRVVEADGSDDHRVLTPGSACGQILWSADSRHLRLGTCDALYTTNQLWLATARGSQLSVAPAAQPAAASVVLHGWEPVWSPDSRLLAYLNPSGINLFDTRTGKTRLLVAGSPSRLAWSPDGRGLAYLAVDAPLNGGPITTPADLRTVTISGKVSTVVHADAAYGGVISELAWTRAPTTAYPKPPAAAGIYANDGIDALAADGGRVVYAACGRLFSWTPSTGNLSELPVVVPFVPNYPGWCGNYAIYTIAVANDRIAYGTIEGGNNRYWALYVLAGDGTTQSIERGDAQYGAPTEGVLAGAGNTLAYTAGDPFQAATAVRLVGGPTVPTSEHDPPQPIFLDMDADHLLVGRADDVEVFDLTSNSKLLQLTIAGAPSSHSLYKLPADIQLAGQHLAIRNGDVLYDYDLTGTLQHTWPLASGARLQDGTTNLLAYTAGGKLHVLCLSDGLDQTVATANLARFMGTGLAYANGPHLKLIPLAQLPAH